MEICPECNGKGYYEILISNYWEGEVEKEKIICPICYGKKEIDKLKMAVYKARGGAAPLYIQGFA